MKTSTRFATSLVCMLLELPISTTASASQTSAALRDEWSPAELQTLVSMQLRQAGPRPTDPSNAYEANVQAANLGRALFDDTRLSRNGSISCANCHFPSRQFEDGKPLSEGLGMGSRRTMPVMGASRAPFLFWDGRKDSLWSQALGPMENSVEHGSNRGRLVRVIQEHYATRYKEVFGPLPALKNLPADASPLGTKREQEAWTALPIETADQINRVFANMGKAIAAYESRVQYGPSRFDQYVQSTIKGDSRGPGTLTGQEVRGLRLFLSNGQCTSCHNGPMLTDYAFHNTGIPPLNPKSPDRGRADAIRKLMADDFNCLGPFSDAKPEQCGELNFLSTDDPGHLGAFRTPSLRNVAARPPYMHAGQFPTLLDVVRHYAQPPKAMVGQSELARPGKNNVQRLVIQLTPQNIEDLVAFLGALSGSVIQPK